MTWITPLLVITKVDLADPSAFLAHFTGLDLQVVTSTPEHPPVDALLERADVAWRTHHFESTDNLFGYQKEGLLKVKVDD